jgi:hypothetical protein
VAIAVVVLLFRQAGLKSVRRASKASGWYLFYAFDVDVLCLDGGLLRRHVGAVGGLVVLNFTSLGTFVFVDGTGSPLPLLANASLVHDGVVRPVGQQRGAD